MFEGFSPEAIDFLWGIRFNNNRDWYMDHKKEYQTYLNNPLKALGADLFQPFLQESGHHLKVCRILRDTRMHYEIPYRDSLWLSVRPDTENWFDVPNLYFAISPEGVDYGLSLWRPQPSLMEKFRRYIAAEPTPFLEILAQVAESTGVPVTAECYKRPKPCDNEILLPYFSWKCSIECTKAEPVSEAIYGPELGERVMDFWLGTKPLYDYLHRICTQAD